MLQLLFASVNLELLEHLATAKELDMTSKPE